MVAIINENNIWHFIELMSNFKLLMIMRNLSLKEMRKVAVMFVLFVSVAIASMSAISEKQSAAQQVSLGCGYMAGETEGSASGGWIAACAMSGAAAGHIATGGTILGWNPVGWGMWAGAGACAL